MNMISGIYKIVNTKNGKFYLGSSKNIKRRWYIHKSALKHNRHHCIHLQRSWNKHGGQNFSFEIIKELPGATEPELLIEETKLISELKPQYNIGSVGGGDNLTNNPNRNDIIRRITETLRVKTSLMTEQERKEKLGRPGDKNPNWQGGISKYYCIDCGIEIYYGSNRCMDCSKKGTQNPFYGKHHSEESKQKSSLKMKGRLPSNTNPIVLNGVSYISQSDAARKLNVSIGTISNWVRGKIKQPQASLSLDVDHNLPTECRQT
jgi:group I intron endonuclease